MGKGSKTLPSKSKQIVDFDEPTATDNSGTVSVKRWVDDTVFFGYYHCYLLLVMKPKIPQKL